MLHIVCMKDSSSTCVGIEPSFITNWLLMHSVTMKFMCRYAYFPSPYKLLHISYITSLVTATNQKLA